MHLPFNHFKANTDTLTDGRFKNKKTTRKGGSIFGAAGRIRTADLILTKDALYLLSYSSARESRGARTPRDGDREGT